MAATIQIIVAGLLLLAWIWVLGRPLLTGGSGRNSYASLDRSYLNRGDLGPDEEYGDDDASDDVEELPEARLIFGEPSYRFTALGFIGRWWRQPTAYKRRQLMLATMFAAFGSFLLAIALRGRFLQLFGLMVVILLVHVIVAARIGGKIAASRRAVVVAEAKQRVQPDVEGIRIRAPQVGGEPVEGAEELAAMLRHSDASTDRIGITSYVSDLIDLEWGDGPDEAPGTTLPATAEDPTDQTRRRASSTAARPARGRTQARTTERQAPVEEPAGATAADHPSSDAASDEAKAQEPIFTRAAKDTPARSRRKARPIYIESQLDESDDLGDAKAVNHS